MGGVAQHTDDFLREMIAAVKSAGSVHAAATRLDVPYETLKSRIHKARKRFPNELPSSGNQAGWALAEGQWQGAEAAFEYPEIPDPELSYEELKARQIRDFERLAANREATKLIRVRVKIEGPYGVMVKGDPHVDNPGTNWPLLEQHIQLLRKTEGLFGANVGDLSDNWVGRLARLYAGSSVSKPQAIRLVEGYLREVPWLWIDPGNHDLWSGADDPVRWITRFAGVHYKWQGSRLELVPPSGQSVTVNSRHDHPGYSQYHATHGPLKAAIWDGFHDTIYTCGHIHSGGSMVHPHNNGRISHIFRASSYKVYDSHKDEKGFLEHTMPARVFVIDPHATCEEERVISLPPEAGADYLTFKRKRFLAGKSGGRR